MNKLIDMRLYLIVFVLLFKDGLKAQQKTNLEIIYKRDATHIVGIHQDTLTLLNGRAYLYTVDLPENEGLISTQTTVPQLLSQITAKDGSAQQYQVINKE